MRLIVQNVTHAEVKVDNQTIGQIGRGLLVFVGFCEGDDEMIAIKMAHKLVNERVFPDDKGLTNLSILAIDGEILSISQFTLYADLRNGLRPSFTRALHQAKAKDLYAFFNQQLTGLMKKRVATGVFGADMKVELINDGPFTIFYDSEELMKK